MLDYLVLFLQIMLINIVLSGDNAVVIAMASKNLPPEQRKKAVWWGAFGAIALRLVLTVIAVAILQLAYIQAIGSLLLLWIAVKLLVEDEGAAHVAQAATLGKAVTTIIMADLVMSLDNVLAIAAKAQGNLLLIVLGIGLSIPIIIWGSTLVMNLLHRYPVLIFLGAGILGYTAGEMMLNDRKLGLYLDNAAINWVLPIGLALLVVLVGLIKKNRDRARPV
ncbi:TerC family protein [Paenibacillus senegalensis]|uniref:TerC family protein n=1 Tax=Paenibacillus senegalensis TaxID=1465766 RepID=UPI000289A216|nr:TerC family protein [Paenibacillus senegalensis]